MLTGDDLAYATLDYIREHPAAAPFLPLYLVISGVFAAVALYLLLGSMRRATRRRR